MALGINRENETAYIRIARVNHDKASRLLEAFVDVHIQREVDGIMKPYLERPILMIPYVESLDGVYPYIYEHLKTLPQYEGASDC